MHSNNTKISDTVKKEQNKTSHTMHKEGNKAMNWYNSKTCVKDEIQERTHQKRRETRN